MMTNSNFNLLGNIDCNEVNCFDILFWMTLSIGILLFLLIVLVLTYMGVSIVNKIRARPSKSQTTSRSVKSSPVLPSKNNKIKEPRSSSISIAEESDEERELELQKGVKDQADWVSKFAFFEQIGPAKSSLNQLKDTYKKRSLSYANHELKKQIMELTTKQQSSIYSINEGYHRDVDMVMPPKESKKDKRNLVLPPKEKVTYQREKIDQKINNSGSVMPPEDYSSDSSLHNETSKNTQKNIRLPRNNNELEKGHKQKITYQNSAQYQDNSMELNEIIPTKNEKKGSRTQNKNRDKKIEYY